MGRNEKTSIVFPRISNHDGPARTLKKEDFIDASFDPNNPLFDPLRYGFSDDVTYKRSDLRTMITLKPPITATLETRNSQRFRANYKRPDDATRDLIRRRRGR